MVGSGISGLSAAWPLGRSRHVTLFERAQRPGGRSHMIDVVRAAVSLPVDTRFIVYNEPACPNLAAVLAHLSVRDMAHRHAAVIANREVDRLDGPPSAWRHARGPGGP